MEIRWVLLVATLLVAMVTSQTILHETCDRRQRFATVRGNADVMLAGVFPIRTSGQDEYGCGDVGSELYRIMTYEAARFAVERINTVNFIPGMTLGLKGYDSCSNPHVAVAGLDDFFQESSGWQCSANSSQLALGAIGGYFSDVTAKMANYLEYSSIPHVAFASEAAQFSDKNDYPILLRTGAPMEEMAKAVLMTLGELKWTRVGIIYGEDDSGRNMASLLKKNGGVAGICVAEEARVAIGTANRDRLLSELQRLVKSGVGAVVLAVGQPEVLQVLQVLDQILPSNSNLQIISPYRINGNGRLLPGTVSVLREESAVSEFLDHLARIDPRSPPPANPWFQQWYMTRFSCRLPATNNPQFSSLRFCNQLTQAQRKNTYAAQLDHSVYREVIQAVYAFAASVRQARNDQCRGRSRGSCPQLTNMSHEAFFRRYLQVLDYTMLTGDGIPSMAGTLVSFDENGDSRESHRFAIYNYNRRQGQLSYKQVGNYTGGRLQLDPSQLTVYDRGGLRPLSTIPEVQCTGDQCGRCLTSGQLQYWFTPGDVIIVGLTSLHKAGADPSTCGTLDTTSSFRSLAFQQAVSSQNTAGSPIRVGSLLVDVCGSEAKVTDFLNRFYSGTLQLRDESNKVIDPSRVVGTVDMLQDDMARTVAQYLSLIKLPVVGTVASNNILSDSTTYPYYSQRVPTDDKAAETVVHFLQNMGWSFIQAVYSGDSYGRSEIAALKKAADAASVCIAESLEIGIDGDASQIVRKLRRNPSANVVVVLGSGAATDGILRAIRNAGASRSFVVITTEQDEGTLSRTFPGAEGRTFSVRISDTPSPAYDAYLRQLDPQQTKIRFVTELYQRSFQCQIGSFNRPCNSSQSLTDSTLYDDTAKASSQFVSRAVTLMGNNIKVAYTEVCPNCSRSFDTTKLRQGLQERMATEARTKAGVFQILGYRIVPGEDMTKIAEYSDLSFRMTLTSDSLRTRMGISKEDFSCQGFCGQCSYLVQRHPYIYQPGNIMLGSLIGVMGTDGNPFTCDNRRLGSGYQHAAAVLYALERVNSGQAPVSLNNLTVGSLILDDCNSNQRAVGLVNEIYSGVKPLPQDLSLVDVPFRGWVSHSQSNVFNVASNLQAFGTPIVASDASSIGENEMSRASMMYSTAAIFNQKAVTIIRTLKSLGYQYFQTIYSSDSAGKDGLDIMRKVASEEGVCLVKAVEISDDAALTLKILTGDRAKAVVVIADSLRYAEKLQKAAAKVTGSDGLLFFTLESMRFNNKPIADNVISIQQELSEMSDYQNFLASRSHESDGFYKYYYQSVFLCDFPGSNEYNKSCAVVASPSLPQDSAVQNTINGVYAFVAAIHKTLQDKCGRDYNGACAAFRASRDTNRQISENLSQVSFSTPGGGEFGFTGRRVNQNFDVVIEEPDRPVNIGVFNAGRLLVTRSDLLRRFASISSTCKQPCLTCTPQSFFDHVPGDIYVTGIFNIHYKSVEPFLCGKIKTIFGYQSMEAFKYALEKVNRKEGQFSGLLNGVKLGGLALDSCDSAVRTAYLAANIHNGETVLSKNGTDISPDDIVGYVAARESDQSRHLARVLNTMDIPQISYGSTSIELLNTDKYPHFARTVPIDDKQSDAILAFLDQYDLRYVQVLQSPTSYGELSSKAFREKASARRICVSHTVTFRDKGVVTRESATEAVSGLMENPTSNVVIVFADIGYINEFLRAVKRIPDASGKFFFVGTVSWNRNEVLLEGVEEVAHGSVIINVEKVDIPHFDRYLEKKTLASERDNTWFQEYYETIHNCLVTVSVENRIDGKRQCDRRHQNIVTSGNYLQDPDVLHVTNAVYAAAFGVDYALKKLCGQNYTGICRQFRERDSRRELMFEGALNARFQDEAFANFHFTEERSGNKGYTLYAIEPTSATGTYNYKDIGKFSGETLNIRDFQTSWNGSCDRQDTCNECPGIRDQTTRILQWSPRGRQTVGLKTSRPQIVAVFDLHEAQESDEFRCGAMNHKSVFDNVLAFIYTLDMLVNPVNRGFEIGGIILDTCSRSVRLYPELLGLIRGNGYCNTWRSQDYNGDLASIMGVISHGEDNALVTNRILNPMAVTSVSPNAVSPVLSDIEKYPFFLRTKPPYDVEGQAILDLLRSMGWTFVSLVYSDDVRGRTISNYMLKNALGDGSEGQAICIGTSLMLADGDNQDVANQHVSTLDQQGKRGSRVAVWLTSPGHSEMMLEGIRQIQPDTKTVTIGLHNWGLGNDAFAARGEYLVNGITLKTFSPEVPDFIRYKEGLEYPEMKRYGLPPDWFDEFYQHAHACYLSNTSVPQTHLYKSPCDRTEKLTSLVHDPDVFHTIISTYTMATGLNKVLEACGDKSFEECVNDNENLRTEIFQKVWEVKWPEILDTLQISRADMAQYQYEYTAGRYGNTGYLVYNVARAPDTGEPFLQKIGRWNGTVEFDHDGNYTGVDGLIIESACYLTCSCRFLGGQTAAATGVGKWGEAMREPRNYYMLEETELEGKRSYHRIIEWPLWAVIIAILTCIMIIITLIVFAILLFLYPVRSGTTVLGFMLLLGILGIFLINFAFFVPASAASCGARRFVMGVVYAICFAALLVKAVDNWRYKSDDYYMGKRKYKGVTSACSYLLIALALVAIQILIGIVWLVITAPGATLVSTLPPPHDFWWCNPPLLYDVGLVLSFMFIILLLIATIIFATLSFLKNINHNESRYLLASCLCTAAIFVGWMIISTMATAPYRDVTVAIANLLNGTILLIFFPLRKVWLMYKDKYGNRYENKSRASALNMSATEHMEMNERKRLEREREYAARSAILAHHSMGMDQSLIHSSGHQSDIYSQPRAYAVSSLNRSTMTEKTVAGNLRQHAAAAPPVTDMRREQRTTTVVHKSSEERHDHGAEGVARVGRKDEGPGPVIITELVEKPEDRRPDDQFILMSKPHTHHREVRTTRTYREDMPDTIPANLSASYEVDELSFDPNLQSQRTEWHRHETITTGEPVTLPIHRLEGPPSKSRSSSPASSFTSSRLDRPLGRPLESDLIMGGALMELDTDPPSLLTGFEGPSDGKVDKQTKKTTVVETGDDGTTKKTTTVEETSYFEY